jgi:hypothetical protein
MTIPIQNYYDKEISYDQLVELAYDPKTPDELATSYQQVLQNAYTTVHEWNTSWERFIFLQNPKTKKVHIWFD